MKITVCQFHSSGQALERDWAQLVAHTHSTASELVLLPEMPFYPWLPRSSSYLPKSWGEAIDVHDQWEKRFPELGPTALATTRPIDFGNGRNSAAFLWDVECGMRNIHTKSQLENREGAWEPVWYVSSPAEFTPVEIASSVSAFLVGAEILVTEAIEQYARDGVTLLLTPRSSPASEWDYWLEAGRRAAQRGGFFSASSNRAPDGAGWVIDPGGAVLAITDGSHPFVTLDLKLGASAQPAGTTREVPAAV